MRNCETPQLPLEVLDVSETSGGQSHGERVWRKISRGALAGSVNELRGLSPSREIFSQDAVVRLRARPSGVEPAVPKLLTLGPPPVGQTLQLSLEELSEGLEDRPAGSGELGPDAPCGADQAVKPVR